MPLGRRWTEDEKNELRRMWRKGVRPKDIAAALNRTVGSIHQQRIWLGLPHRITYKTEASITLAMTYEQADTLRDAARIQGQSVSEYVRQAIAERIKQQKETDNACYTGNEHHRMR